MRAVDRRGNFNDYFSKRFAESLKEIYEIICKIYTENNPDYVETVPEKIDNHIDFVEMLIDCGFSVDDDSKLIQRRLSLFSQALDMGELPTGNHASIFLGPLEAYLEKIQT